MKQRQQKSDINDNISGLLIFYLHQNVLSPVSRFPYQTDIFLYLRISEGILTGEVPNSYVERHPGDTMEKQKNCFRSPVLILILTCCMLAVISACVSAQVIGGDTGWYIFHSHADGTVISLDSTVKGVITDGELSIPVYTTGTPYATYTAAYDSGGFHESVTKTLPMMPGKGESIDIYLDITPVPTPSPAPVPKPIGGDQGWYDVYCNVPGASVSFDGDVKGTISGNSLTVPVYTTGTPYSTITVSAPDYVTVTESLDRHPAKGETVDLYITLNREGDIPMIDHPSS